MFRLIFLVIGYLFGCIQSAFILGKITDNIDIRKYGSGNAGTTNIIRVLGWRAGVITFLGDFTKAIIAIVLCKYLVQDYSIVIGLYTGLGVIIGHNWPFYMNFKGGKGIASTIGTMLAIDWRIGLLSAAIILLVIFITKYVSLGSIILAICIPILILIFYRTDANVVEVFVVSTMYTISALYRHRANIKRLLNGNESKIGQRSKNKVEEK